MIKEIYYDKSTVLDRNIACIGYFDGVHKGHKALIDKTIKLAKQKSLKSCLITFKPDPLEVISKKKVLEITSFNQRIKLFESYGIDIVLVIDFNEDIMNMSYKDFNNKVLNKLNVDTLICGYDFTYGKNALGNVKTLKTNNFNLIKIDEIKYYGKKISSSRIRQEILKGNFNLVNKLLGYEYK